MNFKRKQFRSSTMKKCTICGSQRRQGYPVRGGGKQEAEDHQSRKKSKKHEPQD